MYKKVLYNIKKIKKTMCAGRGGGAIFEPKTLSMYLKRKKRKNMTEPGLEPTTSVLEKQALLSTRLNTLIGITKFERENYNIQTAIIQKSHMIFF